MVNIGKYKGCKEDYKKYKNEICLLDIKKDKCYKISNKNTVAELLKILKDFTKRQKIFNNCREARIKYSKKCYDEIDIGHSRHLDFLEREEIECGKIINTIRKILIEKQKSMDDSKKLLKKLTTN
jgi:hypothetical protein